MSNVEGRPYDPQKDAAAQEPLTANEVKLVTRLFGDPFAFPLEFKAWLRGWLEEQFPRLAALSSESATGAAGSFVPPAGSILDYGGDIAPSGYLLCNGAGYNKTLPEYQKLFAAIGYKYGGSGNTFNVPDFQGRMSVGKGTHADVDAMGDNEGQTNVGLRSAKHAHTVAQTPHGHGVSDPGHAHNVSGGTSDPGGHVHRHSANVITGKLGGTAGNSLSGLADQAGGNQIVNTEGAGGHTHSVSGGTDSRGTGIGIDGGNANLSVGPGGAPVDSPGFLVVNKIISLGA